MAMVPASCEDEAEGSLVPRSLRTAWTTLRDTSQKRQKGRREKRRKGGREGEEKKRKN